LLLTSTVWPLCRSLQESFGRLAIQNVVFLLRKQQFLEHLHRLGAAKAKSAPFDASAAEHTFRRLFADFADEPRLSGDIALMLPLCQGRFVWNELPTLAAFKHMHACDADPRKFRQDLATKVQLLVEKGLDLDKVIFRRTAVAPHRLVAIVLQALDQQCTKCHGKKRDPKRDKVNLYVDHDCDSQVRTSRVTAEPKEEVETSGDGDDDDDGNDDNDKEGDVEGSGDDDVPLRRSAAQKARAKSVARAPPAKVPAAPVASDGRRKRASTLRPVCEEPAKVEAAKLAAPVATVVERPGVVELKVAAADVRKFHKASDLFDNVREVELPVPSAVSRLSVGQIDEDVRGDPSDSPLLVAFEDGAVRLYASVRAGAPYELLPRLESGVVERLIWGPDAEYFVVQSGKPATIRCFAWDPTRPGAPAVQKASIVLQSELADACACLLPPFRLMVATHEHLSIDLVSAVVGSKATIDLTTFVAISAPSTIAAAVIAQKDIVVAGGQLKARIGTKSGYVILIRNGEKQPFSLVKFDFVPKAILSHGNYVLISNKAAIFKISLADPHKVPQRLFDVRDALLQGGASLCALPGGARLVGMTNGTLVSLARNGAATLATVHASLGSELGPLIGAAGRRVVAVTSARRPSILIATGDAIGSAQSLLESASLEEPELRAGALIDLDAEVDDKQRAGDKKAGARAPRKRKSHKRVGGDMSLDDVQELPLASCRVAAIVEASSAAPFDCLTMSQDARFLVGFVGAARSVSVFSFTGANWRAAMSTPAWTEVPPTVTSVASLVRAAPASAAPLPGGNGCVPRFVCDRSVPSKAFIALCTGVQVAALHLLNDAEAPPLLSVKKEKTEPLAALEPITADGEEQSSVRTATRRTSGAATTVSAVQRYFEQHGAVLCAPVSRSQFAVALPRGETRLVSMAAGGSLSDTLLIPARDDARALLLETVARANGRDVVSVWLHESKRLVVHMCPIGRSSAIKAHPVRLRAVHRTALAAAHELTVDMTTQGSRLLLLFGCGRRFCLVDVETKEATERELPNEAVVTSVAFAASALMLFVGLSSSKVGIFDARSVAPLTFVSVPSLHRIAAHPRVPELFFVTTKGGGVHLVGPGLGHNTWYAAAGADDQMTDSSLLAAQRSAAALDGDSADADALLKRKKSASAVNAPRAPRKQTTRQRG
jgi:hypothetical protein